MKVKIKIFFAFFCSAGRAQSPRAQRVPCPGEAEQGSPGLGRLVEFLPGYSEDFMEILSAFSVRVTYGGVTKGRVV